MERRAVTFKGDKHPSTDMGRSTHISPHQVFVGDLQVFRGLLVDADVSVLNSV